MYSTWPLILLDQTNIAQGGGPLRGPGPEDHHSRLKDGLQSLDVLKRFLSQHGCVDLMPLNGIQDVVNGLIISAKRERQRQPEITDFLQS